MLSLPRAARVLERFRPAFSAPVYERFLLLCIGAIITMGRRTVSHVLWSVCRLMGGRFSSYHRVFSSAKWSSTTLGKVLAAIVLELIPKDQPALVAVDDTVDGHGGDHVYGKGCHRDAVRSSRTRTVFKFGHKWVVLAVRVKLPLCKRAWALPVLTALYVAPEGQGRRVDHKTKADAGPASRRKVAKGRKAAEEKTKGAGGRKTPPLTPTLRKRNAQEALEKRRKTPALLARQMMAALIHWFPDRQFILLGDGGFASHDLAWFCRRHRRHVTLAARTRGDMNLYALPPARGPGRPGAPARKGRKLPTPEQSVAAAGNRRLVNVRWYGDSRRDLQLPSGCGCWYRRRGSGRAEAIAVRWVCAFDPRRGRDDYFYTTDPAMPPRRIVELFAGRWSIEVTFEETRAHLGLETTRHWCKNSVLRVAPCLFGLFTVVSVIYGELARQRAVKVHATPCYHKTNPTFADALAAVRRLLWQEVILKHLPGAVNVVKFPPRLREMLLEHLTAAA